MEVLLCEGVGELLHHSLRRFAFGECASGALELMCLNGLGTSLQALNDGDRGA